MSAPCSHAWRVREDAVHRSVYVDPSVFAAERERLFGRAWLYAAHESQLRAPGTYHALTVAGRPIVLARGRDGVARAFFNRCPHRGARLVRDGSGALRQFRCPYHAWTFDLAGRRLSVPLVDGYEETGLDRCAWTGGLAPVPGLHDHRGFLFVCFDPDAMPCETYFGGALHVLDDMVDRSPVNRLSIVARPYRIRQRSNWKLYIENLQDTVHPHAAHESSTAAADDVANDVAARDAPVPFRVQLLRNNGAPFPFWEQLEQIAYPHGHTTMGGIVGGRYDTPPDSLLRDALVAAKGEAEADRILSVQRHNTIFYPGLAVQSTHHQLRVVHPIAPDETIVEVHHLRIEGAPEAYYRERTLAYTNTVNAPSTMISADDIDIFRRVQEGLAADAPEWLSLHRDHGRDTAVDGAVDGAATAIGTSELPQRAQLAAWREMMAQGR